MLFRSVDFDLRRTSFEDPEGVLNQTRYTQPCMVAFAAGLTAVLREKGIVPAVAAGLSLGEYSALHAAGVCRGTVIAPGGSCVCRETSIAHMRELGTAVYLKLSLEEITGRIRNLSTRGIALAPGQTLADVYQYRVPLYEKCAHITVPCGGQSLTETVEAVKQALARSAEPS